MEPLVSVQALLEASDPIDFIKFFVHSTRYKADPKYSVFNKYINTDELFSKC